VNLGREKQEALGMYQSVFSDMQCTQRQHADLLRISDFVAKKIASCYHASLLENAKTRQTRAFRPEQK